MLRLSTAQCVCCAWGWTFASEESQPVHESLILFIRCPDGHSVSFDASMQQHERHKDQISTARHIFQCLAVSVRAAGASRVRQMPGWAGHVWPRSCAESCRAANPPSQA